MITIGIDPGNNGCFSALNSNGAVLDRWRMPTIKGKCDKDQIKTIFDNIENISIDLFEPVQIAIEKIFTMPSDTNEIRNKLDTIMSMIMTTEKQVTTQDLQLEFDIVYKLLKKTDGRVGIMNYAQNYGVIIGMILCNCYRYETISPRTWQADIFKGTDIGLTTKDKAYQFCQRNWPNETLKFERQKQKYHDGLCDSLCIAEYFRRKTACKE